MLQFHGAAITSGLGFGNTDSPAEGGEFETEIREFSETFLYRFRAANWPGATAGF